MVSTVPLFYYIYTNIYFVEVEQITPILGVQLTLGDGTLCDTKLNLTIKFQCVAVVWKLDHTLYWTGDLISLN